VYVFIHNFKRYVPAQDQLAARLNLAA